MDFMKFLDFLRNWVKMFCEYPARNLETDLQINISSDSSMRKCFQQGPTCILCTRIPRIVPLVLLAVWFCQQFISKKLWAWWKILNFEHTKKGRDEDQEPVLRKSNYKWNYSMYYKSKFYEQLFFAHSNSQWIFTGKLLRVFS